MVKWSFNLLRTIMLKSESLKCLVTGATGLLGRRLVDVLVASGVSVRAFIRPSSNASHLINQGVELLMGTIDDWSAIRQAAEGVDMVFHVAGFLTAAAPFTLDDAQGSAVQELSDEGRKGFRTRHYSHNYDLYQVVNVDYTELLLDACLAAGCGRFIFVSSSSVYAPDVPVPTPEESFLRPLSAYGRSKLMAEEAVRTYQYKGLPATIIRPSVIYGPGDRHFTPLALRLSRLPLLPLVNGGRSLIDLVYVGDVADLMWRASLSPEAINRVYNAGSGQPTTLFDLVQTFRHLSGGGPHILSVSPQFVERIAWLSRPLLKATLPGLEFTLSPEGIAMMNHDHHLSMKKAASELDFQPSYRLEDGLKKTIKSLD
jgi:nucleoside-diphosphate-sugar epimerase